jgi:hypothetical protein
MDFVEDWQWVNHHLPLNRSEGNTGLIAYDADKQERLAALICEDWTPTSMTCHFIVANPVALRHNFHAVAAKYLFTDCGRQQAYVNIKSTNKKALKFCNHLGFGKVARLKDAYDKGVDSIIMELHRDDCPYWQLETRSAANG